MSTHTARAITAVVYACAVVAMLVVILSSLR